MNHSQRSIRSLRRALAGHLGSLLLVGIGTALVVGSGGLVYLAAQSVPRVQPLEAGDVVVVSQEVEERMAIPPEALRLVRAPMDLIPANAVTRAEEAEGKLAAGKLMPGEMLLKHRLMERTGDASLAIHLRPNEVAVTFPAAGIASVSGLLPGDRVDVLVTIRPVAAAPGQLPRGPFTTVALQDQRILSVSRGSGSTRQGSAASRAGSLVPIGAAAEGTGQVVIAATYEDALFLKALKDADNVSIDLVLRPVGKAELIPGEGVSVPDGFRQRRIPVP